MRWVVAVVLWLGVLSCGVEPELVTETGVPGDVENLASAVWEEFLGATSHMGPCLGSVHVAVDPDLEDRARYDPDESTVVVRTPATAARLRQTLLHELAHHLDYSCLGDSTVRDEFMQAIGVDHIQWFAPEAGQSAPAEIFADSVSFVLQDDEFVRMRSLPSEGVEFVEVWLAERRSP